MFMNTKDMEKERICCFYASNMHLEIMILPYINSKLEKNEEIYLVNEDDLEETVKNVIEKINLKEEKKQKILKLNWNKNDTDLIKEINNENENALVIINGSEKFNNKIEEKIDVKNNLEIVNCYNIEEIEDIEEIKNKYTKVLNSVGIKEFI